MIMDNINLNKWRDRAYKTACDHGLHDKELSNEHCLCLVISELMEAVEADRKGKRADRESFKSSYENEEPHDDANFKCCFEKYIKDTLPDELSDAVIRLLDLCGLRKIDIEDFTEDMLYDAEGSCTDETFTESIYAISTIPIRCEYEYDSLLENQLNSMILAIFGLAKHMNIDLIWHVEQKMRYNELRPKLNGKRY
jgi:hypothetical protein